MLDSEGQGITIKLISNMNDLVKKNLWISIFHPYEIVNAVGLSLLFRERYKIHLLVGRHPYWNGMRTDFYEKYFNTITWFPCIGFSKHYIREIRKIIETKKIIQSLLVQKDDVYITLSNKTFVDNIFFSINKNLRVIKMVSKYDCIDSLDQFCSKHKNYKEIINSKIWNLTILPLFGLERIAYLENQDDRSMYELVYKRGDNKIFNNILFIQNYNCESLGGDEIYNFMALVKSSTKKEETGNQKRTVVFFGEGVQLQNEHHFNFINNCLRYIEKYYPEYNLVFKPHPIDPDNYEANHVELGKFSLYQGKEIAQLYLLERINEVKFCFGISSTSLNTSKDLGIPTYYFLKLYTGYSPDFYNLMLNAAGKVDEHAFIRDLNVQPSYYEPSAGSLEKFNNHINKLFKYLN